MPRLKKSPRPADQASMLDHRGRTRAEREAYHEELITGVMEAVQNGLDQAHADQAAGLVDLRRRRGLEWASLHSPVVGVVLTLEPRTGVRLHDARREGDAIAKLLYEGRHMGDQAVAIALYRTFGEVWDATVRRGTSGGLGPLTKQARAKLDQLQLEAGLGRLERSRRLLHGIRMGPPLKSAPSIARRLGRRLGVTFVEPTAGEVISPPPVVAAPPCARAEARR